MRKMGGGGGDLKGKSEGNESGDDRAYEKGKCEMRAWVRIKVGNEIGKVGEWKRRGK